MTLPAFLGGIEVGESTEYAVWMFYFTLFLMWFVVFTGTPEVRALPFGHWFKDAFERPFRTTALFAGSACLLSIVAVWLATLPIPLWLHILPAGALMFALMGFLVREALGIDRDRDLH